jgi:hypothetical protein
VALTREAIKRSNKEGLAWLSLSHSTKLCFVPTDSIATQVQSFADAGGIIYSLSSQAQAELNDYLGEYRPTASKRRLHVLRLPRLRREIQANPEHYSFHVAVLDDQIVSVMISSRWQLKSDIYLTPPPDIIQLDALASFQEGTGAATALVGVLAQQDLRIKLYTLAASASFYRRLGAIGSYRYQNMRRGQDFIFLDEAIQTLARASRPHFGTPLPVLATTAGLTVANFRSRAGATSGVHSQIDVESTQDLF